MPWNGVCAVVPSDVSVRCAAEWSVNGISYGRFRGMCCGEVCRRHIVRKLPKDEPHLRDLVVGYADVSVKQVALARVPLFLQSGRLGVILTFISRKFREEGKYRYLRRWEER